MKAATRYISVNLDIKDSESKSLALDVSENYTVVYDNYYWKSAVIEGETICLLVIFNFIHLTINSKEEGKMIPLTLANMGEDVVIKKVGGSPDVKKHLEDLGLIAGSTVKIVNTFAGNVILDVKNSRIAVNSDMAGKIMV